MPLAIQKSETNAHLNRKVSDHEAENSGEDVEEESSD